MTEDINVIFIIPPDCESENECSEEMQLAFTACEQHSGGGINAKWCHQSQWTKFDGLTKRDVLVLSAFEGDFFNKLKTTKCLLVGPRCLSCCLTEGSPIPSGPEPVFTVAMRGLVVTASGLTKEQKENMNRNVHWMGGLYNTVLREDTTHLVSNTVLSDKYIKAVEKGIPVMNEIWVDAVWEESLRLNVNGSSSDFDRYKLKPFANLQITTSGITKQLKQKIMKLVNENGGTFSGAFQSETTDVVVLTKDGVGSEKYKAAQEYGKTCVLPEWVEQSAARGVALPAARFRVAGASTSSPLSEHRVPDMSLNFSRITMLRPPSNFVDESRSVDVSTISGGKLKLTQDSKRSMDSSMDKETVEEFEKLDMSDIKKAGPIFDGFCIWLTGLEGVCRERAAACVSRAGGVRYSAAHERVTHVVASGPASAAAARRALPHVPVLRALWLLRSVRAARVLDESEYLLEEKSATPVKSAGRPRVEPASPMSARNLQLLRHAPAPPLDLPPPTPEEEPHDEIVNHYLTQNVPEPQERTPEPVNPQEPDVTGIHDDEPTEEVEQIFRGMKIEVRGLDEESVCEIGAEVAAAGGRLVGGAGGGAGDAARVLVPLDWPTPDDSCVTAFWIIDCLSQQELLPVEYYHRPVKLPQWEGPPPLEGVVACLSTYCGMERAFLDELAKLLGAVTQLRFCRRNTATSLASTHLVCPSAVGDKYAGAVKWGLPAVRAAWLCDCAAAGRRLSEEEYLVGETRGKGAIRTPPLEDALSTPNLMGLSPTTRRRLQAVRRGEMPSDPIKTPTDPFERVSTRGSAFGAALRPGSVLSPDARKRLWSVVQELPARTPQPTHNNTPLSEIRNRFLVQFNGDVSTPPADHSMAPRKLQLQEERDTPPAKIAKVSENQSAGSASEASPLAGVDARLQRLSAALAARTPQRRRTQPPEPAPTVPETEPAPESQPNIVGWDDTTPSASSATGHAPSEPAIKIFMLSSNVDNREEICAAIAYLGGSVCDSAETDPRATHLLCAAPGRTEKMLGSIAAGKWVLHPAYVARSRVVGSFLPEEEFEWGNPKATCLPALSGGDDSLAHAAHRWRSARSSGRDPPFVGLRALLHVPAPRARVFARLLRAGGGAALEGEPPYTDDTISVCFADVKRYPLSERDSAWLISKKIPVCPPVLLSSYLIDEVPPNPVDHCLPDFRPKRRPKWF